MDQNPVYQPSAGGGAAGVLSPSPAPPSHSPWGQVLNAPPKATDELFAQFKLILGDHQGSADVLVPGVWAQGYTSAQEPQEPLTRLEYVHAICPKLVEWFSISPGSAEVGVLAKELAKLMRLVFASEGEGGLDRFESFNRFVAGTTERGELSGEVMERFNNLRRYRLLTNQLKQPGIDNAFNRWEGVEGLLSHSMKILVAESLLLIFSISLTSSIFEEDMKVKIATFGMLGAGLLCYPAAVAVKKYGLGEGRPSDNLNRQLDDLPMGTQEGLVPLIMAEGEPVAQPVQPAGAGLLPPQGVPMGRCRGAAFS